MRIQVKDPETGELVERDLTADELEQYQQLLGTIGADSAQSGATQ